MIPRFCAYGFLKDLRFADPFLVVALDSRGVSFATIGGLIAVREISVNLLEMLSGAIADSYGRRLCMVLSMGCMAAAFALLAMATSVPLLAAGMLAWGIGEAFRSGSHKALIYGWLEREQRVAEKTRIYGVTRSWARIGAAVAALGAPVFVIVDPTYVLIFWASCAPAVLNMVNVGGYPADIDIVKKEDGPGPVKRLFAAIGDAWRQKPLRRVLTGSLLIEGGYNSAKHWAQALLLFAAFKLFGDDTVAEPLMIGIGMALIALVSALGSRFSHTVSERVGDLSLGARRIAFGMLIAYGAIAVGCGGGLWPLAFAAFVVMALLQNLWRPIQLARIDEVAKADDAATLLSIESQGKSAMTAVLAPLLGWMIDTGGEQPKALWPVGLVAVLVILALPTLRKPSATPTATPAAST